MHHISWFVHVFIIYCIYSNKRPTSNWAIPENIHIIPRTAFRISEAGLEIKKIFRSPFGDQPENYSRQMQIFSRHFVKCKWRSSYVQSFWYFEQEQSREIHKNMRNTAKFSRNLIKCNIFETYLSYWGYLLAVNLQIYLDTSSLKRANNVPKLPGVDCVAKNWALAMMLKALPLVHFWSVLLLKEKMMTSVRKMLVWSAQNRSISDKIFPKK